MPKKRRRKSTTTRAFEALLSDDDPGALTVGGGLLFDIAFEGVARAERARKAARAPRPNRASPLPPADELLRDFNRLIRSGKTGTEARAALYERFPDVNPDSIRKKLRRAKHGT